MRRDTSCTLDPGLTALALRGLSKPSSYPFVERHMWRRRAAGLGAAILVSLRPRTETQKAIAVTTPGIRSRTKKSPMAPARNL